MLSTSGHALAPLPICSGCTPLLQTTITYHHITSMSFPLRRLHDAATAATSCAVFKMLQQPQPSEALSASLSGSNAPNRRKRGNLELAFAARLTRFC